jgi:hypothetical protein
MKCNECLHIDVCRCRIKVFQGFADIIDFRIGGKSPEMVEFEEFIGRVCKYKLGRVNNERN